MHGQYIVESPIDNQINIGQRYGDVPTAMLVSKFDETNMFEDEELQNNYMRLALTDRRPDTNLFAHEESRGASVTARAGRLNLQYGGHRGVADDYYVPDRFQGFGGHDDHDPRGTTTDPNMAALTAQERFRQRYIRFSKDGSEHTTSGSRSESKVIADQQTIFKITRDRLKVFSSQLDGHRNGMTRIYGYKSAAASQLKSVVYGELIVDPLAPTRRNPFVCGKKLLERSAAYLESTADGDRTTTADYTLIRRTAHGAPIRSGASTTVDLAAVDGITGQSNVRAARLATGLVLAGLARSRTTHDADSTDATDARVAKSAMLTDMSRVLAQITADSAAGQSTESVAYSTPGQNRLAGLQGRLGAVEDASRDALIRDIAAAYSAAKYQSESIAMAGQRDERTELLSDNTRLVRGMVIDKLARGPEAAVDHIAPRDVTRIHIYKGATAKATGAATANAGGRFSIEDNTTHRGAIRAQHRVTSANDVHVEDRDGENYHAERHGGGLGSKYMREFMDRENTDNVYTDS